MKIKFGKKYIEVEVKRLNLIGKIFGLMFKTRNTQNIIFDFPFDISLSLHSWFVFFDFYAIWLDKDNNVLEFKKVNPFSTRVFPAKNFRKIIEIPVNKRNIKIVRFLDGKGNI